MSFSGFKALEQVVPPRERYVIMAELNKLISIYAVVQPEWKEKVDALIKELEQGAWEVGAHEGYVHGWMDGCER